MNDQKGEDGRRDRAVAPLTSALCGIGCHVAFIQ